MNITRFITRTRAKAHAAQRKQEQAKTRKALLARNKAVKEANRKEALAQAKEEAAAAKARKKQAEARLNKNQKKTDWKAIGREFFSHFDNSPRRTTKKRRKSRK